jgi:hypothetical protein
MSWPWEVVERDHELQNPTSGDKIRLVGEYMRLDDRMRVLPPPPEADAVRETHERRRSDQIGYRRTLLGWAIFVGRKA